MNPVKKTTGEQLIPDTTLSQIHTMQLQISNLQQELSQTDLQELSQNISDLAENKADKAAGLDAEKIIGKLSESNIPDTVKKHFIIVGSSSARKELSNEGVQNGDTVLESDTGIMYIVKDQTHLDSEAGYEPYVAYRAVSAQKDSDGNKISSTYLKKTDRITNVEHAKTSAEADLAKSVGWKDVQNRPKVYPPDIHTQNSDSITKMTGYQKADSAEAILETDSLNQAIGKLEKQIETVTGANKHNHVSSEITKLQGYEKLKDTESLNPDDSLNEALGKLEYRLDHKAEKEHEHTTRDIRYLRGYQKFKPGNEKNVPSDLSPYDDLNTALAKLEFWIHSWAASPASAGKDEDGKNIKDTYARKEEIEDKLDSSQLMEYIPEKEDPLDPIIHIPTIPAVRDYVSKKTEEVLKALEEKQVNQFQEMNSKFENQADERWNTFLKDVLSQNYWEDDS